MSAVYQFSRTALTEIGLARFYTLLPPSPPEFSKSRTFVIVPPTSASVSRRFVPAHNARANDEIEAHTGMFAGATNDGYYALGLAAAKVVREAVMAARGVYDRDEGVTGEPSEAPKTL